MFVFHPEGYILYIIHACAFTVYNTSFYNVSVFMINSIHWLIKIPMVEHSSDWAIRMYWFYPGCSWVVLSQRRWTNPIETNPLNELSIQKPEVQLTKHSLRIRYKNRTLLYWFKCCHSLYRAVAFLHCEYVFQVSAKPL